MAAALNRRRAVDGEGVLHGRIGRHRERAVDVDSNVLQRGLVALGLHLALQDRPGQRAGVQINRAVLAVQTAASADACVLQGDILVSARDDGSGVRNRAAVQLQIPGLRGDRPLVGEVRIDEAVGPPLGCDRQILADRKRVPAVFGSQIPG